MHVEPHPVDYGFFEGVIPEGNYGAGPTIIWDRGRWQPLSDPVQGLEDGKLLFDLHGYKLLGRWTLVKARHNWLLIKEKDGFASEQSTDDFPADSVLSGLTVDELRAPARRVPKLRRAIRSRGGLIAEPPSAVEPMLCVPAEPRDRPGWLYEIKYDGIRLIAHKSEGTVTLRSRSGRVINENFPELVETLLHLPYDSFVLDGEIVVADQAGLPSFQRLLKRSQLSRTADIERATLALPATYYVFDLLFAEGYDLRGLELEKRKAILPKMLPSTGAVRFAAHFVEQGTVMWHRAKDLGLEGVVAKQRDSTYRSTRSATWEKWPIYHTDSFSVIGLRASKSNTADIGAIYLAQKTGGGWTYRGRAGSGLNQVTRTWLEQAASNNFSKKPVTEVGDRVDTDRWLKPKLIATIRYLELTDGGLLRQPVVLSIAEGVGAPDEPELASVEQSSAPNLQLSNLDKVFWPELGRTKGDLIEHYRRISRWMLPWLKDRPVVLTRYPDGIHGKSFFQHNAPDFAPSWIRRHKIVDPDDQSEKQYFVVDSEDALLYLANLGTIPIHMWSARVDDLDHPDYCVLDLDPKEAPFDHVITLARGIHRLCDEIGLPNYVKTTGKSGLHILIPLGRAMNHDDCKSFGELLARVIVKRNPDIATIVRAVTRREGKVYVDFLQNGSGKTIAASYSVRENVEAGVSMPLTWREVNRGLKPTRHAIESAATRMRRKSEDPCIGALNADVDLGAVIAALVECQR